MPARKAYQTGKRKSMKLDKLVKSKSPGKRISRRGNEYTERRRNRSDLPGLRF